MGMVSVCLLSARSSAQQDAAAGQEIFLVGSVHNMHFQERFHYSLVDLEAQVRSLRPDVVCGEIAAEDLDGPMEGNYPPEAAMLAELAPRWGARFIAADWRVDHERQARAEAEVGRKKAREIEAAQNKERDWYANFNGPSLYDYTNGSPEFQAMIDHKFEDLIGDNTVADIAAGAWHERNRHIVENCLTQAGPARRIVFVFGAAHVPQLWRQLAARGLVGQIPLRNFTPAGLGTMHRSVIERWQRNLRNLHGIADGSIPVSSDMRARVRETRRAPVLRNEIDLYVRRLRPPWIERTASPDETY